MGYKLKMAAIAAKNEVESEMSTMVDISDRAQIAGDNLYSLFCPTGHNTKDLV